MIKRITSYFMVLTLACTFLGSFVPKVSAQNINITPYGSFDKESDLEANTSDDWSTSEWIEDKNGGGYVKTSSTRWWKNTIFAQIPLIPNETYTISADVKSSDTEDKIDLIDTIVSTNSYTGRVLTKPSDLTLTTEWKTFTFTYKNNCTLSDGTVVSNDYLKLGFRRGVESSGQGKYFYVDNLKVIPSGESGFDWNDYINSMWGEIEPFNKDDGFVPEKAEGAFYKAFYVDAVNGNDNNAGIKNAPLKTIKKAKEKVRPHLSNMTGHIYVYIKGNINLDETVYFGTEDSGRNGYNVIYTSWGDEKPEITMKNDFSGFSLFDKEKNIYRTYVGKDINSRQVYINGVRAVRAKTDDLTKNGTVLTNPSRVAKDKGLYYISYDTYLADLTNQSEIEFVCTNQWTNPRAKVERIYKIGKDRVRIDIDKGSWEENKALSNQSVAVMYPMWIENAYELLDSPGEWYINKNDGYLYYKPRAFETPETMIATIPYGERAFVVAGNSTDEKIHNIEFKNLSFKYMTWTYPNQTGLRDEQALMIGNYKGDGKITGGTADGAVTVSDAAYVDIKDCEFSHLGGHAVFYTEVFQKCEVLGNHIYDISASGIVMGHNNRQRENYLKYIRTSKYKNYLIGNKINNNLVHDIGVDYMSAPGVTISLLINSEVKHNEIYNTNYSGIHVGWGWTAYDYGKITSYSGIEIMYNYIHDTMKNHLYDGGSIYVLGHTGGKNTIAYNYLENHRNGHGAIYFDEGSDRWHAYGNVIDLKELDKWETGNIQWLMGGPYIAENTEYGKIYNNFSTTENYRISSGSFEGTQIFENAKVFENANWPDEAQTIVDNAGLESEYLSKYPDSIQRLRVLNEKQNEYFLEDGETMQFDITAYKRKLKTDNLSDDNVFYYSSNKNVATVSDTGLVTSVGHGKCAIYAEVKDGEALRRAHINIVTHAPVKEITSDLSVVSLLLGETKDIKAIGKTIWGGEEAVIPSVTFEDNTIATAEEGILTGVKEGKTVMHATYSSDGVTLSKDITVYVSNYNKGNETLLLQAESEKPKINDNFFKKSGWTLKTEEVSGGLKVSGTTENFLPAYYKGETELLSFDVTINNPMSWPSFVVGAEDINKNYKDSCYLITLKQDKVELYRFNKGERCVIFGSDEYERIGADAYSHNSLFKFGRKFSVTVGTKKVQNGTQIVLIINGVPVFDYTDTENFVQGKYFGIYEWSGDFTLSPFTNITK